MPTPISPSPLTTREPEILPAYLSNGVIGLRVRQIPFWNGTAVISGYGGQDPVAHVEATTYAPYPLGGDIGIGRFWLSEMPEAVRFEEQSYDFTCGELHTRFSFTLDGVGVRVSVLTFCSRSQPTLVLQEIAVEPDSPCDLSLRVAVDPTGIPGRWYTRAVLAPGSEKNDIDGSLRWQSLGDVTTCGVAYVTDLQGAHDAQCQRADSFEQGPLLTTYTFRAQPHQRYMLRQIASMVPEAMHHAPDQQAAHLASLGHQLGFDGVRQENREAWDELWRGRIHLQGAERRWQAMADAAFYYLHASVHPSSPSSCSPFGLARWYNYNYYYGHIMWDLETFSQPALVLTYPQAAFAMLRYRAEHLEAARRNAEIMGYRGAQFPWQSSMTRGEECTPPEASSNLLEQHVSLDVALAFAKYVYATGDEHFQREQAWPVLRQVAEWVASRVTQTARGYELLRVIGPDEDVGMVNNDAYTNMEAVVVLRTALECARQLGETPPAAWTRIARALVIPKDAAKQVLLNYEGHEPKPNKKGSAPTAAAGLFPGDFPADSETERATLACSLELAPHYIGAPMLSTLYAVFAAWIGDRKRSLELFEQGYAAFVQPPFCTTGEMPANSDQPHSGPFFANLGGFLMDLLYGLPGLRLGPGEPASWCSRPVVLPEGWDALEVERIWVRGQPAHLLARQGAERASIAITSSRDL